MTSFNYYGFIYRDHKVSLDPLLKMLQPRKYFMSSQERVSSLSPAQVLKDSHDSMGLVLSNLELLMDHSTAPWLLSGLYKKGHTINVPNIRGCLIDYFKHANKCGEWSNVAHDLAVLLTNAQKQSDNQKLVVNG